MPSFTDEDVERALDLKAQHVRPDDVERVAQNQAAVQALIDEIPESLGSARAQAKLLFDFVSREAEERHAPFPAVAQAVGALLYLSSPLDLVPDSEAEGYQDDAAILGLAVRRIEAELREHCERKGIDPSQALGR